MMEMPPLPPMPSMYHDDGWHFDDLKAYARAYGESCARMAREEAAKLCEELASSGENSDPWTITRDLAFRACAAAIRKEEGGWVDGVVDINRPQQPRTVSEQDYE